VASLMELAPAFVRGFGTIAPARTSDKGRLREANCAR
jgi:hypothetical protein